MRRTKLQFTLGTLILTVALVGINLAAAIATSAHYPRERRFPKTSGSWGETTDVDARGNISISWEDRRTKRSRLVRVVKYPPPPNLMAVWSPIVASASLSVLVLVLLTWSPPSLSDDARSPRGGRGTLPWSGVGAVSRSVLIVVSLVGLNVAAVTYRSPPRSTDPWSEGYRLPDPVHQSLNSRSSYLAYGTVVYRLDGSIVGFEGEPGKPVSRAHVFFPATRSPLELWWPVIGSAMISLGVLAVVLKPCWSRRVGSAVTD